MKNFKRKLKMKMIKLTVFSHEGEPLEPCFLNPATVADWANHPSGKTVLATTNQKGLLAVKEKPEYIREQMEAAGYTILSLMTLPRKDAPDADEASPSWINATILAGVHSAEAIADPQRQDATKSALEMPGGYLQCTSTVEEVLAMLDSNNLPLI